MRTSRQMAMAAVMVLLGLIAAALIFSPRPSPPVEIPPTQGTCTDHAW